MTAFINNTWKIYMSPLALASVQLTKTLVSAKGAIEVLKKFLIGLNTRMMSV